MGGDDSLTGQLIYTARLCRTARAELLLEHGLYTGQDVLLNSLADEDGQTMSQLAANLGVRPPTVTKMVTRMEAQGLVRRQASPTDNRLAHVHIAEAGNRMLALIERAWAKAEAATLAGLKDKDEKRLRKILKKIRANLSRKTAEPDKD